MKKAFKVYYIYCKDGIISRGESGRTYWSWEFETMNLYADHNPASGIAKEILGRMIHDRDLGFEIEVIYEDKTMKEIL